MTVDGSFSLSPDDAPALEVQALIARVETLQETQRREDVEGFVALTAVRQQYLDADDEPLPGEAGLPSYVWRRDGDRWLIVAGQNTAAAPSEG